MPEGVEQPRRVNVALLHESMRVKQMLEEATAALGELVGDLRDAVEAEEEQRPDRGAS